jgi:hypothetical protein
VCRRSAAVPEMKVDWSLLVDVDEASRQLLNCEGRRIHVCIPKCPIVVRNVFDPPGECLHLLPLARVAQESIKIVKWSFDRLKEPLDNAIVTTLCRHLFVDVYEKFKFKACPVWSLHDTRLDTFRARYLPDTCKIMFESTAGFKGWRFLYH